ncbi:hypothetical protein GNI_042980 [Gregarina niphandrodes]|uniref:Uncharacterized protein n=1 Tax=Gregarina niphandrodes TaxID=110365 RepID=A0A023BA47_GRENI|nr:hypothetical protein GNI_042980 [Gregarina niphandrodes]EZG77184.1 hypothetical protein GNI_042980 [Gregarina niphandrodes]|eukprot:XP_011129520.1 hypothetical protein GNI_042980 [Gregarina niphandrodes]
MEDEARIQLTNVLAEISKLRERATETRTKQGGVISNYDALRLNRQFNKLLKRAEEFAKKANVTLPEKTEQVLVTIKTPPFPNKIKQVEVQADGTSKGINSSNFCERKLQRLRSDGNLHRAATCNSELDWICSLRG